MHVTASQGSFSTDAKLEAGPPSHARDLGVGPIKRLAVRSCLLVVEPDDLRILGCALAQDPLEPCPAALVQLGPFALGQRF